MNARNQNVKAATGKAVIWAVRNRPDELKSLLQRNGMKFNGNLTKAVLYANAKSAAFRKDLSSFLATELTGSQGDPVLNFVDSTASEARLKDVNGEGFLNFVSNAFYNQTGAPYPLPYTQAGQQAQSGVSGGDKKGSFDWSGVQNVLNTSLGLWGQNMENKATQQELEKQIEIERIRLEQLEQQGQISQAQLEAQLANLRTNQATIGGGRKTTNTILVVAAVAVVGGLLYKFVIKK